MWVRECSRTHAPPPAAHALEAAGAIIVRSRHYRKERLGVVARGDARRCVDVVAEARIEPHAIDGHAIADGDSEPRRVDELVPLLQVVPLRRLIEDT